MFNVITTVVYFATLLSLFVQPGVKPQPTIDPASEDDFCSRLEDDLEYQAEEEALKETLEKVTRSQTEDIQRLKLELENERSRPVTATLIRRLEAGQYQFGITKVEDKIYVLGHHPDEIKVFEDKNDFSLIKEISMNKTSYTTDIVYSVKSNSFYISDKPQNCIWVMKATGEQQLTKWLTNITIRREYLTLSLSNEGHLLVLREEQSLVQLDTYSLNATLIRRLQLPQDIKNANNVVQTLAGNFIISHQLNNGASDEPWVLSLLTNYGVLISRFIPRDHTEMLIEPRYLCLDSENNRLFLADYFFSKVLLFDSNRLTWIQVLLSAERNETRSPWRLFYDTSKKHLLVSQLSDTVHVFEIN